VGGRLGDSLGGFTRRVILYLYLFIGVRGVAVGCVGECGGGALVMNFRL
jgi:hypothetical protein